jgi:histidine ammonia-lyase/tyrosine ammonia-lyase
MDGGQLIFDSVTAENLDRGHQFLMDTITSGEPIYGVTTGFGPLVDRSVTSEERRTLQQNLLQQLSVSTGPDLPVAVSRATVLLRAIALSQGKSGVRSRVLQALVDLYNSGAVPRLQSWGSVGASGDLVPLTRLARVLTGQDELIWPDGTIKEVTPDLLRTLGVEPLELEAKEGLGLVNGTSFSLAMTALCWDRANYFLHQVGLPLGSSYMLLFNDSIQHLHADIYKAKPHETAQEVAAEFRSWLAPMKPKESHGVPQPPYSSRSQVLWYGAVEERLQHARQLIEREMASVDDNPLVDPDAQLIHHAANFQGTYVAMAADAITQAVIQWANLVERQLNRLLHDKLNGDYPAFLAPEPVGLHSGMQGMQLLATSLLADLRTKAQSHATQTYPTNQDNQDVVSMSANAALNLMEVTRKAATLAAVAEGVFARALQIYDGELTPKLDQWWKQREELLQRNWGEETLYPIIEDRAHTHLPWDDQWFSGSV